MLSPADPSVSAETKEPGHAPGSFHSVPDLIGRMQGSTCEASFRRVVNAIPAQPTETLIARIATTDDPLKLWVLHLALDRRNVPPCLRWPTNDTTAQTEFITLLADLLWFTKRTPTHRTEFKGWRDLLKHEPDSPAWHAGALRQYLYHRRGSLARRCALGLAVTGPQRQELMTMPTKAMAADRRQLEPRAFQELRQALGQQALDNPDRAGKRTPAEVAERRARIWRTYILAGRSPTRAAAYWQLLTGEPITRQALSKQLVHVEDAKRQERVNRPTA